MPSVIEAVLLPRIMGWGKAAEILLTGDMIDAQDAKQCGLIQQVTPKGKIDEQVDAWLTSILSSGPQAVRIQASDATVGEPAYRRRHPLRHRRLRGEPLGPGTARLPVTLYAEGLMEAALRGWIGWHAARFRPSRQT